MILPGESSTGSLQNDGMFFSEKESQKHLFYPLIPCLLASLSCLLPMWTSWKTRDGQVTPVEKPHKFRSFCLSTVHGWTREHPFRKAVFKSTLYSRHATLSLPPLRCTRHLQRDFILTQQEQIIFQPGPTMKWMNQLGTPMQFIRQPALLLSRG